MRLNPTLALWCLIAVSILCLTVRPQYARAEESVGEYEDGTACETYDCDQEECEDCEDCEDCCDEDSACDEWPECEPDEQCEDEVDECETEDLEECEPEEMEECQEGENPEWYGWPLYADECPEGTEECDECEDEWNSECDDEPTDCIECDDCPDEHDDCSECDESENCVDECEECDDSSAELECDDDCTDEYEDCSECDEECSDEEQCGEELDDSCTSPTAYWATHNAETTGTFYKPWPLSENTELCGKRWIDILTTASARAAAFTGAYTEDENDDRWNLLAAEWISAKLSLASGVQSDHLFDALLTQAEEILSKCEIVEEDDDAAYHDWNVLYAWNSGIIGPGTCCSDDETEDPECPYVPPVSDGGDGNSGDGESGDGESGDGESGDGNGDGNSGDGNGDGESGDGESGDGESGDGESGDGESGDGNSGDGNSGDGNSGDGNSGDGESGDGNSGDGESGDGNSGDGESGDGNSGDGDNEQGQTSAPTPPPGTSTTNDDGTVKAQVVSNGRPSLSDDDGAIGGIVAGLVGGVIVAGVVALVLGLALFGLLKLSGGAAGVGGFAPDAGALAGGTMNPAYAAGGVAGSNQLYV